MNYCWSEDQYQQKITDNCAREIKTLVKLFAYTTTKNNYGICVQFINRLYWKSSTIVLISCHSNNLNDVNNESYFEIKCDSLDSLYADKYYMTLYDSGKMCFPDSDDCTRTYNSIDDVVEQLQVLSTFTGYLQEYIEDCE